MASIERYTKRAGPAYRVRYRDPAGRSRAKTFDRKIDAETFLHSVEADKRRGDYIDPKAGRVRLSEYAELWQAERANLSRATRDADASMLRSQVLPTFGDKPVSQIRQSHIRAWLAGMDRARSYRLRALWTLEVILDLAVSDKAISANPADGIKLPKGSDTREGRALGDIEVHRLLGAAEQVDPTLAPVVWLMVRAGLRVGEALALRRSDIDLGARTLTVNASMSRREGRKNPKTSNSVRTIPIPDDLVDRLAEHMEATVVPLSGLMFCGAKGGAISYSSWRSRKWTRIVELAKLGDLVPHDLRKTCATRLFVVDRWTPGEVQKYLGHKSPTITLEIYTKVRPETLPAPSVIRKG